MELQQDVRFVTTDRLTVEQSLLSDDLLMNRIYEKNKEIKARERGKEKGSRERFKL